jgi:membrane protein implicated in regulation of membrane protease activity
LAIAATVAGTLYSQSPALPFTIAAISASALGLASFVTWRRVPGHVTTELSQ